MRMQKLASQTINNNVRARARTNPLRGKSSLSLGLGPARPRDDDNLELFYNINKVYYFPRYFNFKRIVMAGLVRHRALQLQRGFQNKFE